MNKSSDQTTSLSARIKDLRQKKEMSASMLARRAQVSPASVWHWENKGTSPRPETLATVAKTLGVTPEYLLHGRRKDDRPGTMIAVGTVPKPVSREASLEDLIKAIEEKGFWVTVRSKGWSEDNGR